MRCGEVGRFNRCSLRMWISSVGLTCWVDTSLQRISTARRALGGIVVSVLFISQLEYARLTGAGRA